MHARSDHAERFDPRSGRPAHASQPGSQPSQPGDPLIPQQLRERLQAERPERQQSEVQRAPETGDPTPHFRRAEAWVAQLEAGAAEGCRVPRLPERATPGERTRWGAPGVPAFHWNCWWVTVEPAPRGTPPLLTVRLLCERKHVHAVFGALDEPEARRKIREFEHTVLRLPEGVTLNIIRDEVEGELPGAATAVLGPIGFWGRRKPARKQLYRIEHRLKLVARPRRSSAAGPMPAFRSAKEDAR